MRKWHILPVIFSIFLIIFNCASGRITMQPPEEGKNLLIGSIIFENIGYQDRNQVFTDNIEVAIIGYYEENGKEKLFGKWVITDKDGYFFIPNVPDGKYAIKGLRVDIETEYLTIENSFRSGISNYQRIGGQNIAFSGTYFDKRAKGRLMNLKHNRFTIYKSGEIRQGAHDIVTQFTTSTGQLIERPFIHEYFIEKFPDSEWRKYLEADLKTYKGKQ